MPDYTRVLDGGEKFIIIDQDNPDPLVPSFLVRLTNPTGAQVQHQMLAIGSNTSLAADTFAKIPNPSATAQNTPLLAAGVGFVSGMGISAVGNEKIIFDTAAQNDAEAYGQALVEFNSSGTAGVIARLRNDNQNINGITQNRCGVALSIDGTGAAFPINNANLPIGTEIRIRVTQQIR